MTTATDYLFQKRQNAAIEGPSKAQAVKMAKLRQNLLAEAAAHLAAGRDERAFGCDERAFDLECDLRDYGFDVETGKVAK